MKIVTKRRSILATALVVAVVVTVAVTQWASAGTPDQSEVIGAAMAGLTKQGVPVQSWSLDGTTLTVSLQSASATDVGTPDDPMYLSLVQREAFLAKSRGMNLSCLQLDVTNTLGKVLFAGNIVLDKVLDASSWSTAKALPATDTVAALGAALAEKTDLADLALGPISLTEDSGPREIHLTAVAADAKAANLSTASLMLNLHNAIDEMNASSDAQIALVRLDITDNDGEPLLKWIYDAQRGAQDWWQAPGMTTDWFETPRPVTSATEVK